MAKRRKSRSASKKKAKSRGFWSYLFGSLLAGSLLLAVVVSVPAFFWIDYKLQTKFDTPLWDIPVHIYSQSYELYPGLPATLPKLQYRLENLGFRRTAGNVQTGQYRMENSVLDLATRAFTFWDGSQNSRAVRVNFSSGRIASLTDLHSGKPVSVLRLNPKLLGSISQIQHEDRYLVRLQDMPKLLLETLIAVEDKNFVNHPGVDFKGILRSIVVNVKAGRIVQGGSTLTQQLIKNVFEADERTYRRKLTEIAMALVMEFRYEKTRILEAYCNEVFLGQDGKRAIHGFGLASQFYFGRPVSELAVHEVALLVGMIKAPSSYEPRHNPERATKRREVVLKIMKREGLISEALFQRLTKAPLGVIPVQRRAGKQYATFIDAVLRQLPEQLSSKDLASGDFAIFTTMDAYVQRVAERTLQAQLATLEIQKKLPTNSLEGAIIVVRPDTAEVVAMVGGRRSRVGAFNRVLDAKRPIGSLVKPIVYAAAFENGGHYTLGTIVNNRQFTYKASDGKEWTPRNYSKEYSRGVTVLDAVSNSINIPTARVGLDIGVPAVVDKLHDFIPNSNPPAYPALLLGAVEYSPAEIAQVYQGLVNFGFKVRLRTISAMLKNSQPMAVKSNTRSEEVISSSAAYLTLFAMQEVARSGTARSLNQHFSSALHIAGKTGTTNDYRDSWFAGSAGNYLAVVWVGRDDNQPVGLSGSTGALKVWTALMNELTLQPFNLGQLDSVVFINTDMSTGLRGGAGCSEIQSIPYIRGTEPRQLAPCANGSNK